METVIIGGGIAGLTVAHALAKQHQPVVVLERYPNFGGRIVTYRENKLQYEIGAGRIFKHHERVNALVKRYGLHTFPISAASYYKSEPNPFLDLFVPIAAELAKLPQSTLESHTIKELIPKELHPILTMYPYAAEVDLLRADIALPLFQKGQTMGTSSADDYYGVAEGLDAIIANLKAEAEKAGAILLGRHRVHDIKRLDNTLFEIQGDKGKKAEALPFTYTAKKVIIATCRCSLGSFSVLKHAPLLKQLSTSPLVRIYATYPKIKGKVWFEDLPKIVTDTKLRYVIPINPKKGLIMISYTDGKDTDFWRALPEKDVKKEVIKATAETFPDLHIPEPTLVNSHVWDSGCTYWTPGHYDLSKAIKEAMNPAENLYVVGESISKQQAWIEGALESAETLIKLLLHNKK